MAGRPRKSLEMHVWERVFIARKHADRLDSAVYVPRDYRGAMLAELQALLDAEPVVVDMDIELERTVRSICTLDRG